MPGPREMRPESARPSPTESATQDQRDDADGAAREPEEVLAGVGVGVHAAVARHRPGLGARERPAILDRAVVEDHDPTPLARAARGRALGADSSAALASVSARSAVSAIAVAWITPVQAGRPVDGSIRWCAKPSSVRQIRVASPLVATAPGASSNSIAISSVSGCSTSTIRSVAARRRSAGRRRRRRRGSRSPRGGRREIGGQALAGAARVEAHAGRAAHDPGLRSTSTSPPASVGRGRRRAAGRGGGERLGERGSADPGPRARVPGRSSSPTSVGSTSPPSPRRPTGRPRPRSRAAARPTRLGGVGVEDAELAVGLEARQPAVHEAQEGLDLDPGRLRRGEPGARGRSDQQPHVRSEQVEATLVLTRRPSLRRCWSAPAREPARGPARARRRGRGRAGDGGRARSRRRGVARPGAGLGRHLLAHDRCVLMIRFGCACALRAATIASAFGPSAGSLPEAICSERPPVMATAAAQRAPRPWPSLSDRRPSPSHRRRRFAARDSLSPPSFSPPPPLGRRPRRSSLWRQRMTTTGWAVGADDHWRRRWAPAPG